MRLGEYPAQDVRDILLRAQQGTEVVLTPDSRSLVDFHALLIKKFRPGEVEPLEVFQDEMSRNQNQDSNVRFIGVVARDPLNNEVISGAYGSVQDGILAIRFTLTEGDEYLGTPATEQAEKQGYQGFSAYRSTGVSQWVDELLVEVAREQQKLMNPEKDLVALVCEAVPKSQHYWNKLEIEPGNGMRRLYKPESGEEVHYELPPLAWNKDGTPAQEGITEHLQIAVKGHQDSVLVSELEKILKDWWKAWYIRPRDQFESNEAWELHKRTVWNILENNIIAPIRDAGELKLIANAITRSELPKSRRINSLDKVVVGEILSISNHPYAKRIRIARVNVGEETLQIIFGGPNIGKVGDKVAVALPGTMTDHGKLKPQHFRQEASEAMICSAVELGFVEGGPDEILILSHDSKPGASISKPENG
ncbi:MAG: hypothetical protein WC659_03895 [Patescibacteria group bacterium]